MSAQLVLIAQSPEHTPTVTHTLDCPRAAGFMTSRRPVKYAQVPASVIDPSFGRCTQCGGGR